MGHNLLIFHHEPGRAEYVRRIGEALPELNIDSTSTLDGCEAKLAEADILLAFGAQMAVRRPDKKVLVLDKHYVPGG